MQKKQITKMNKLIKQAFTLIELLVVIAIIGILSGIIVVSMSGVTKKATVAKAQVFSNSLRNTLMMNIVSEYKLDGNVIDSWGANDSGTLSGPALATDCISNTCYSFDGINDYIDLGDYNDLPSLGFDANNWSVFAWVKPNTQNTESTIYGLRTGSDQDFRIGVNVNNKANVMWVSYSGHPAYSETVGTTSLNDASWHHVGAKRYGNTITLYVDGVVAGTDATVSNYDITGESWYSRWSIGALREGCCTTWAAGYWFNFFSGSIDEVRIFNTALSSSQIKEQYYIGLNRALAKGQITKEKYLSRIDKIIE
jgi:prepilin-type N-terminal cleavage/methylation domain-containing protein